MRLTRRFQRMWYGLGCNGPWQPHHAELVVLHMQPHRRHHTFDHVEEFLKELEWYDAEVGLENPHEAEAVAFWHDSIYDIFRNGALVRDNEERSAGLCDGALRYGGASNIVLTRIGLGILDTKHRPGQHVSPAMRPVMDADMAILGSRWERYARYMRGIEYEYRYSGNIRERQYLEGRISLFLEKALEEPHIYHTDAFHAKYDVRARNNMKAELRHLSDRLKLLDYLKLPE